jgi:hypothetical protein
MSSYEYHQILQFLYFEGYADSYAEAEELFESMSDNEIEELNEALLSSLIKAAARQVVKSKALQKAVPKKPNIPIRNVWDNKPVGRLSVAPKAPKKLEYQKLYHGTTKPSSQAISKSGWKTDVNVSQQKRGSGVYVTPDKKTAIGYAAGKVRQQGQTPEWDKLGIRRFNMPKNVYNNAMRRQAQNPDDWANISQVKQVTMKPSYANKIDITDKPKSAIDFTSSQRKEIRQRVRAGLQRPANIQDIKRQLGIKPKNSSVRKESVKEQKTFSEFMIETYSITEAPFQIYGPDPHGSSDSESRPLGKPYKNKKRAKTRANRLDDEIGGYRHSVRKVNEN